MSQPKRYVLVGTGGRATIFFDALAHEHAAHASLAAMCDLSQKRMDWHNLRLKELYGAGPIRTYLAGQFDQMIHDIKPDAVVVCTMDSTHHSYIVRAMELGCDVISEKPMTVDAGKAREIFDAIQRTGRELRVMFNFRYSPMPSTVKQMLREGVIGRPTAVHFSWMLDTSHGADYFRRWHREKDKSGGLLVHKATHHFDLINWWIDAYPSTVYAMGDLNFYGEQAAAARGETYAYSRYTGVAEAKSDPFSLDLNVADPSGKLSVSGLKGLYYDAEAETGYIRDRNVFGKNVTIEDTMGVMVRYGNGVIMTYSLVAYSPWEGLRVDITGTRGRLEVNARHGAHVIAGQSDKEIAIQQATGAAESVRVFPMFGVPYDVKIQSGSGEAHQGDGQLMAEVFGPGPVADPLGRMASHIDGAASMLIGISANESMKTGRQVVCDELLSLPPHPTLAKLSAKEAG